MNTLRNAITFDCPECRVENTLEFSDDFDTPPPTEFGFCCMACAMRLRVISWQPLYLVRDLPHNLLASIEMRA
jgi:hypothetical protein